MKKVLCIVMSLVFLAAMTSAVLARESNETTREVYDKEATPLSEAYSLIPSGAQFRAGAAVDSAFFGHWYFDAGPSCTDEGWVPHDLSEAFADVWHIDDFAGLGGGTFGGLTPIEGNQSLWMGARATGLENLDLCGYAALPGYGNNWDQRFCTKACLNVTTGTNIVMLIKWDSEPGYDGTTIEVDNCDESWLPTRPPASVGGHFDDQNGDSLHVESVPDTMHSGQLRVRFHFFSDGGWSDEDGLWDTDGATIIDSLSIVDNGGTVLAVEDFEDEAVGATSSNDWEICNPPGFSRGNVAGNYPDQFADLYPALTLVQEDPCVTAISCVWGFFQGSTDNYACGGFPGQAAIPKGPDPKGLYFRESIWSPVVPFATTSTDIELGLLMYADNPRDNLVYWEYSVRSFVGGCPSNWRDDNFVYRNDSKSWGWFTYDLGDKLAPGATEIQVRAGIVDMCIVWCGVVGSGSCHSHTPLIDQIRLYAIETAGPAISVAAGGYFNDNFPEDGTLTGTVRMDAAGDIRPQANPAILNGDSATFTVTEPVNGLSTGAFGGDSWASIYAYVGITPQGKYSGSQISDDAFRWPVVDSTTSPTGDKWFIVRLDTAFSSPGRAGSILNRFCVDLNDDLFEAGDTVSYFIAGQSADGPGTWTYYFDRLLSTDISVGTLSSNQGASNDINVAYANSMEATCLPTQHLRPVSERGDILYVDAFDQRGAQPFFDSSFDQLGIRDKVDRFDVSQSGSSALGQFGSRVQDTFAQIIPVYRKIIWNSGTLTSNTVGDGTGSTGGNMKADDFFVLNTFLDQSSQGAGIYFSGNSLAFEWSQLTGASAVGLRGVYMNHTFLTDDHVSIGEPLNPLVIGTAGSCFAGILGPDTLIAFGGCPIIRQFDVLQPTGSSVAEMNYSNDPTHAAIVSQITANQAGDTARVMLSGFSYHLIRDQSAAGVPARADHLFDIITWLQNTVNTPTGVKTTGLTNSLSQNYPNPFNPTTTIEYTLREQSPVQLKIYNVAGQLVRTLVNDVKTAGQVHIASWDGRNDAGQTVSSGVYFYKLTSKSFVQTKKMVLLK